MKSKEKAPKTLHLVLKSKWYDKIASEKTGIPRQSISACCRGKYKTAGGFCWMYTQEKGVLND